MKICRRFKKVLHSQSQDIIQLVLALIQKSTPVHPTEKGLTLKDTAWVVFLIKSDKKHPSCITNTARCILYPQDLPLASNSASNHSFSYGRRGFLKVFLSETQEKTAIYKDEHKK
ncbi:hypothetical protein ACH5RR_014313 [Cinchona calisaya]|uniref:Uncharacterized protein n=1 Tax=Cinchona calisaya TaxID=153742 RepID=A0ABD3A4W4_9GENT